MTRFLFAQTPDGVTHKRKTDRTYTHAVATVRPGKGWVIAHYCGSLDLAQKAAARYSMPQIIEVSETQPEPTHFETVKERFLTAPAVEVVKPSLQFPEPTPGKTFKTHRTGNKFHIIVFMNGVYLTRFYNTKELLARKSVKRFLGLGYALTDDGAKIVSPVSTYTGV